QNKNLESGSGPPPDPSAFVLQAWDTARPECIAASPPADCLHNSQDGVTPCALDACDPRIPYRIVGRQVKFLSFECDQRGMVTEGCASGGTDLNGDTPPDADDLVLRVFDLETDITRTVGTIAATTADPLGGDDAGTDSGTVFVTSGRCIETLGGSCS